MQTPWYFNPVIFQIGPITARWYGFMYALAFFLGYLHFHYSKIGKKSELTTVQKDTFLIAVILGILLGGRLGYVLFYNLPYYLESPLKIFAVWEGGMSFHGGLIGVAIAILIFIKKYKSNFLKLGDLVVSIAPLGLLFGRLGNFINGELYGRIATQYCLYFPTDPNNCRYPSQLLQSFLEGLCLFIIINLVERKSKTPGLSSGLFLILYGVFRIIAEFFREPDPQIGLLFNIITEGQLLSAIMIIAGAVLLFLVCSKKHAKQQ